MFTLSLEYFLSLSWMGFVGQILIRLETSFIRRFLQLRVDVLFGVTYANMLVAIQWTLKHAANLPGLVWYGGLQALWSYMRYVVQCIVCKDR